MSSLIYHIAHDQVFVATDTLATSHEGKPVYFTSKVLILPHLNMLLAGTGRAGFLDRWIVAINGSPMRDVDAVDREATNYLAAAWSLYQQQITEPSNLSTVTIYHFGFSETAGVIHAYAYRSENGFQSERLEYRTGVKPKCTVPENYRFPDDIKGMMEEQRTIQALLPKNEQVFIGGEIQIHHLNQHGFNVYKLAEFDDYKEQKQAVYKT
ncbi:MAG TPA: hypothetical protein VK574_15070 [Terracidiphilus sp.]|nr:hypothetical protein [Terracidiphilus sp.]